MKEKSIELLNKAIADELSAVHQYMYFHFHCDDLGYDLLSNLFKRTAIEEMMHVEKLAERILFLKGEVEMKASQMLRKYMMLKRCSKWLQEWKQEVLKIITNGLTSVQKMPILLLKRSLKLWLTMKNVIMTSTIRKWKTS